MDIRHFVKKFIFEIMKYTVEVASPARARPEPEARSGSGRASGLKIFIATGRAGPRAWLKFLVTLGRGDLVIYIYILF